MNTRGFTLIEIIIILIIIGILATLALPRITMQVDSVQAGEALNIFSTVRRAANDCASVSQGELSDCVTPGGLGVAIPSDAGFVYTASHENSGTATGIMHFKATRLVKGIPNAICLDVPFDGVNQTPGQPLYGASPANSVYVPIVTRVNQGQPSVVCTTTDLGTSLN